MPPMNILVFYDIFFILSDSIIIEMLNLPNFIIVGPGKSGTQTLTSQMREHPQISMPIGEPHFWNNDRRFRLGLDFYKSLFPKNDSPNNHVIIGEKTPSYASSAIAAKRIHKAIPDVKLIWTLRDPVKRTYSAYWHSVCNGSQKKPVHEVLNKRALQQRTFKVILLSESIKNYLKYFDKSQMRFVLFEHYIKDQVEVVQDLYDFVGVDPTYIPFKTKKGKLSYNHDWGVNWLLYDVLGVKKGVTRLPRSIHLQWFMRSILEKIKAMIAPEYDTEAFLKIKATYHHLTMLLKRNEYGYPEMPEYIRRDLTDFYRPYNLELQELLEIDLEKYWMF